MQPRFSLLWLSNQVLDKDEIHPEKADPYRSLFDRDRGRVIHSAKFRRLSHKTQVFLGQRKDYVRTRLTHSLEVAQLGRELAKRFSQVLHQHYGQEQMPEYFEEDFCNVVECACLAHDLGQPPFGHCGERKLNQLSMDMLGANEDHPVFEANKQTIAYLISGNDPIKLSISSIDALLKYKDTNNYKDKGGCCFPDQKYLIEKITKATGTGQCRHPACYIMECADDLAYITSDFEDAIKMNIISDEDISTLCGDEAFDFLGEFDPKRDRSNPRQFVSLMIKNMIEAFQGTIETIIQSCSRNIVDLPTEFHMQKIKQARDPSNEILHLFNHGDSKNNVLDFKKRLYREHILVFDQIIHDESLAIVTLDRLWHLLFAIWDTSKPLLKSFDPGKKTLNKQQRAFKKHHPVLTFLDASICLAMMEKIVHGEKEEFIFIINEFIAGMTERYATDLKNKFLGH